MQMNSLPLVSVITPAFNAEATLRRAHDSVRQQLANWEHIIIDEGSIDATGGIVSALSVDCRVIGTTRANGGPGAALNTGLDLARGKYIAFLDADDEYFPNHLEAHVARLESHGRVDILWGGFEVVCDSPEDAFVPDVAKGIGYVHLSECVVQGTIFARAEVFEQLRFNEDRAVWYQDYDFIERARERYAVEKFALKTYRYYRGHGSSIVDAAKKSWPNRTGASYSNSQP